MGDDSTDGYKRAHAVDLDTTVGIRSQAFLCDQQTLQYPSMFCVSRANTNTEQHIFPLSRIGREEGEAGWCVGQEGEIWK